MRYPRLERMDSRSPGDDATPHGARPKGDKPDVQTINGPRDQSDTKTLLPSLTTTRTRGRDASKQATIFHWPQAMEDVMGRWVLSRVGSLQAPTSPIHRAGPRASRVVFAGGGREVVPRSPRRPRRHPPSPQNLAAERQEKDGIKTGHAFTKVQDAWPSFHGCPGKGVVVLIDPFSHLLHLHFLIHPSPPKRPNLRSITTSSRLTTSTSLRCRRPSHPTPAGLA